MHDLMAKATDDEALRPIVQKHQEVLVVGSSGNRQTTVSEALEGTPAKWQCNAHHSGHCGHCDALRCIELVEMSLPK